MIVEALIIAVALVGAAFIISPAIDSINVNHRMHVSDHQVRLITKAIIEQIHYHEPLEKPNGNTSN